MYSSLCTMHIMPRLCTVHHPCSAETVRCASCNKHLEDHIHMHWYTREHTHDFLSAPHALYIPCALSTGCTIYIMSYDHLMHHAQHALFQSLFNLFINVYEFYHSLLNSTGGKKKITVKAVHCKRHQSF